ncbi:MAG: carboxymuconolactone decarboxylase family protein [candidate division KSB1 bacterium]|nr:carboxymuconolactone decarboxylase family protein [candidate division KSB1 bacterium]
MTASNLEEFKARRERQNRLVLEHADLTTKRFFNLDAAAFQAGALPPKVKELLGLVASTVLRCNDCIAYHVGRCLEEGVSAAEFTEAMGIALVIGGSITIPHVRYAYDLWNEAGAFAREGVPEL